MIFVNGKTHLLIDGKSPLCDLGTHETLAELPKQASRMPVNLSPGIILNAIPAE